MRDRSGRHPRPQSEPRAAPPREPRTGDVDAARLRAELEELCRLHDVHMERIERADDVAALLLSLLDEHDARELRELVRFADRAVSLKHRAADAGTPDRDADDALEALMRGLGVLAHKINNPLTALLGRAQILRMTCSDDPRTAKAVGVIEESGRRIASLVHELSVLVKTGDPRHLERVLEKNGSGPSGERPGS